MTCRSEKCQQLSHNLLFAGEKRPLAGFHEWMIALFRAYIALMDEGLIPGDRIERLAASLPRLN